MRVAVVSESFLPHVNGVTGSVLQVLRHLRRTGHEALVIAPGDPPPICEGFEVVGLPSVGLPGYSEVRLPLVVTGTLVRELARFAPHVIHLASPFVLGGPVARAAGSLDIPVVAVYQTDIAGFARRYGLTAASNAAWRRIRSIHERAHVTLAPSPTAARDLEEHGVPGFRSGRAAWTPRASPPRTATRAGGLVWHPGERSWSASSAGWRPRSRSRTSGSSLTCPAS